MKQNFNPPPKESIESIICEDSGWSPFRSFGEIIALKATSNGWEKPKIVIKSGAKKEL